MSEYENNSTTQQTQEERAPYRIGCDNKVPWDGTVSSKFMPATELCSIISEAFRGSFYDYAGCMLEIPQQKGVFLPTISIFFNHTDPRPNETRIAGVTRNLDNIKEGNNVTRNAIRAYNHNVTYGDKYYLSREAKEAISEYLVDSPNIHKKGNINNDIDWGKVVADVGNRYIPNSQMTKVSWIDPGKFVAEMYGEEDKSVYAVNVMSSIQNFDPKNPSFRNYLLNVMKLDIAGVNNLGMMFGLGQANNNGVDYGII